MRDVLAKERAHVALYTHHGLARRLGAVEPTSSNWSQLAGARSVLPQELELGKHMDVNDTHSPHCILPCHVIRSQQHT